MPVRSRAWCAGQSQPPMHLSMFLEVTDPRAASDDWSAFGACHVQIAVNSCRCLKLMPGVLSGIVLSREFGLETVDAGEGLGSLGDEQHEEYSLYEHQRLSTPEQRQA